MSLKDGLRGNRVYLIIAVFIIIVIILTVLFSGTDIYPAYIPDNILKLGGWEEDISDRLIDTQLFGLESWRSFTYRNNNSNYSAYLTVTTMKNVFMKNENDLFNMVKDTIIEKASEQNIIIYKKSGISGERILKNGYNTKYVIYNGTDESSNITEQVLFIGESWNCEKSSTSIICIGFAKISDNFHNNSELNLKYWSKIIGDKDGTFAGYYENTNYYDDFIDPNGLIYNIICH